MEKKLTLKIEKEVIEKAKEYAASQKRSLSELIEAYLKSLTNEDKSKPDSDITISPFVKSLKTGVKIPADYDYKTSYRNHLSQKHK